MSRPRTDWDQLTKRGWLLVDVMDRWSWDDLNEQLEERGLEGIKAQTNAGDSWTNGVNRLIASYSDEEVDELIKYEVEEVDHYESE